ncbi:hypothetical protein BC829DRAFT_445361 [Chytridium lagenaria]|nr:hypothetical protein BC829DRAFT_445361 [Chytridium lagenaria]
MSTLTKRKWFDDGAINILFELDTLDFSDLVYINSTIIQNPPLAHHADPLSASNITRWMAPVNMGNSHWVLLTAELTLHLGGSKIWGATVWDSRHRQGPTLSNGVMANQLDFQSCGAYTIEAGRRYLKGQVWEPCAAGVWDHILLRKARRDLLDLYDMHGVMEDSNDENIVEAIRVVKYGPKPLIPPPITNLPHGAISGVTYAKKASIPPPISSVTSKALITRNGPVEKFPNITDEDVRAAKNDKVAGIMRKRVQEMMFAIDLKDESGNPDPRAGKLKGIKQLLMERGKLALGTSIVLLCSITQETQRLTQLWEENSGTQDACMAGLIQYQRYLTLCDYEPISVASKRSHPAATAEARNVEY